MSWDDGKHAKVKRVQLTYGDVINSIEVEYDGTSLRSQRRGTIGDKSDGFTLGSDEYITDVTGYYKTTFAGDVITSLTFKTNKKTYGPYGVKTRNYFSVNAPKDNQIAGFHGTSGNALNSIDVHFAPIRPSGSTGSDTGGIGANTGGAGTNTGAGGTGINTGGSGTNTGGSGTTGGGGSGTTGVGGSGTTGGGGSGTTGGGGSGTTGGGGSNTGDTGANTSGAGTNSGSSGPTGGAGTNTGGAGTTGGAGSNTGGTGSNTDDAGSNTGGSGASTGSGPQKFEAQGGKGGNQWDDGSDHDGVMKIYVAVGRNGINFIKFDYVKNGEPKEGAVHGVKGGAMISTIDISYPDEYLVSVEGWYDSSNIIQGIKINTNKKTSDIIGFESYGDGTPFTLQVPDKKIIGFHGFSDSNLNSLGAYFIPISASSSSLTPPNKVEAQGGTNGETWDDGAFDHVKKVYVGQGDSGVAYIKFEYEKDGKIVTREHGKKTLLGTEVFEVDPGDYITSVEVSSEKIFGHDGEIVTALVFKTFKGKTSQPYGMVSGNKSELKDSKGGKLVGFHGKAGDVIYALGAYFVSTPTSTTPLIPGKKLEAKGGDGGSSWDDGVFDGVRKVYVGQSQDGVSFVMFEYDKGSKVVIGNGHGKKTLLGTETFEVDYPNEYITAVEGYYDNITGVEAPLVTSLTFKTNKKTSQPFGLTGGEKFEIKEEGYKIVGFHGKAGDVIHQIGVHIVPITG